MYIARDVYIHYDDIQIHTKSMYIIYEYSYDLYINIHMIRDMYVMHEDLYDVYNA